MRAELQQLPDEPEPKATRPNGTNSRNGFRPRALANQIPSIGEAFYISPDNVIVRWDGEEWVTYGPETEFFKKVRSWIPKNFVALINPKITS